MFKKLGFRSLVPFMIEYEPTPQRGKRKVPTHANGVYAVHAVQFDVNPAGKSFFKSVFGSRFKSGMRLLLGEHFYFRPAKTTRIAQVILKSKSVDKILEKYPVEETLWQGQRAALIRNPHGMWDIVII